MHVITVVVFDVPLLYLLKQQLKDDMLDRRMTVHCIRYRTLVVFNNYIKMITMSCLNYKREDSLSQLEILGHLIQASFQPLIIIYLKI